MHSLWSVGTKTETENLKTDLDGKGMGRGDGGSGWDGWGEGALPLLQPQGEGFQE